MDNNDINTFTEGVKPGGIYNSEEIKILICYMLAGACEPMPRKAIIEILFGNGMANFFEINNAIDELIELKNVSINIYENELISLTNSGIQIADSLSRMIPYTLREQSVKSAVQILTRIKRERDNKVEIEKTDQGYNITCTIEDNNAPMLTFSLRVADKLQADLIKENFLNDPILVYKSVISVLTGNVKMSHNNTRLTFTFK